MQIHSISQSEKMVNIQKATLSRFVRQQNEIIETRYRSRVITYNSIGIVTGNKLRIIEYPYDIHIGVPFVNRVNFTKRDLGKKRRSNLYRVRNDLIDTINANITPYSKLITLTCADDCLDRKEFMERFRVFRTYFQREFGFKLKYAGVTERQKQRGLKYGNEGSWHIHLAVFIDKYLKFERLKACWIYGSVENHVIKNEGGTAKYLAKYLTKDELLLNEKSVLKSNGLKTPLSIPSLTCLSAEMLGCEKIYSNTPRFDLTTGTLVSKCITEYIIPNYVNFKSKNHSLSNID